MNRRRKQLPLLLLVLALPFATGCLFNTPPDDPQPEPLLPYKPYYDPDPETAQNNLVDNFIAAWNNRDFPEYRDSILYNGIDPATDGLAYEPFIFYYMQADGEDPVPVYNTLEEELAKVNRMFKGQQGQDQQGNPVPGIREIDLELIATGSWANPTNPDEVDGDPYPVGTKWRYFSTIMLILLNGTYGTSTTGWNVNDGLIFYLIPIQEENTTAPGTYHTEYRLWKWRDVIVED